MKCCDSSTPTNAFSCDLQWYLLPTLRVALTSFHVLTAVAWNVKKDSKAELRGKCYDGLAMLIHLQGNLEALLLCWTWALLSIFIKPNVEFYHKHGDFKVRKLFSISSQTFANK